MDMIRRKRASLSDKSLTKGVLPKLNTETSSSPGTSSPASSLESSSGDFFQSMVPKAIRSLSRGSTPRSASAESPTFPTPRKVLQKSTSRASSHLGRRGSTSSEGYGRISRASTAFSGSSTNSIDWRSQTVERHVALEPDPQSLRNKAGYLVVTADYIIVLKSKSDAVATFPQIASGPAKTTYSMFPDPLLVIPTQMIVAVFHAESSRPSFGIEVWWRSAYPAISFANTQLFFNKPDARDGHKKCILEMVKSKTKEVPDAPRAPYEVEDCIRRIFRQEEPNYPTSEPEIFPVAWRDPLAKEKTQKTDEKSKKGVDGTSYYFVIGINLCFLVEIAKASTVQEAPLKVDYQTFGLVTLEAFHGEWVPHEERFVLKFRDPFKMSVSLELASRYYKQIILTLIRADKHLKPAWPTLWRTMEIFHITKLPEYTHPVAGDDFGTFQRTLNAFAAAYHCPAVDWEINWRSSLAPEICVLPPRQGVRYTGLQLLAVLKALRYNDYFTSISFKDVDLGSLWERYDSIRKGNIAYINRSGVCLSSEESMVVQQASILHQEFHALCFASETIRQIDFTNSFKAYPPGHDAVNCGVQFLSPILDLLRLGLTKCNRLILQGCALGAVDIHDLVDALTPKIPGQSRTYVPVAQPAISLEVLNIADCGLSDMSLRSIFQVLSNTGPSLQVLNVSGNPGRVSASIVSAFTESLFDMKKFNVSGVLMGGVEGPLLSFEILSRLHQLRELDLSSFKLNEVSQRALDRYLLHLSSRQVSVGGQHPECTLRSLVLNSCGITGYGAGRMFNAMTGLQNVSLHLNGNPLEIGIASFVKTIGLCWSGNFGLHLDMIEFRDESHYISLIKALTINKYISSLSLVGTAPTPTEEATCSDAMCRALEQFFAQNRSVRFLDFSGYSSKLDEGQLGKGVGRSLRGLTNNKTITHLRMRNQNLHDDIGNLGLAVSKNSSIRLLDCEDNNFNLTSLRYITKSLEENKTIVDFPITAAERARILARCVQDVPVPRTKRKNTLDHAAMAARKAVLESEIETSIVQLQSHLIRNKRTVEVETGYVMDFQSSIEAGGGEGWPKLELKLPDGATPTDVTQARSQRRSTVRSSSVPPDIALPTPYRVQPDEDALNSPPSNSPSPDSGGPPTPEQCSEAIGPPMMSSAVSSTAAKVDMGPRVEEIWAELSSTKFERL